jgi:serine/threonine-protein kinase HipA
MTVTTDLIVILNGRLIGGITRPSGWPAFTYVGGYAEDDDATPLSLSMPVVTGRTYNRKITEPWLLNLLPDDANVRESWAREFGVPTGDTTALLEHVGRDCAGAVQLTTPEDIDEVLAQEGHLELVTEAQMGARLRALRTDPQHWARADERWSLAGAQSKFTAVRTPDGQWAYPHGNAASTHIVKPGIMGYPSQAFNEHLCLRALDSVGVASAQSEYTEFDGAEAIVVERYDRLRRSDGTVLRLHQEDMCQAMSVRPEKKYPSEGGPAAVEIATLLKRDATQLDIDRFTDAVVAQYLLGAPDGHAKNYSVILSGIKVALAPVYDVASVLPYEPAPESKLNRVAMPIAGRSRFGEVTLQHVRRFAQGAGTDQQRLVARALDMAARLPEALAQAGEGFTSKPLVQLRDKLIDTVAAQCESFVTTSRHINKSSEVG